MRSLFFVIVMVVYTPLALFGSENTDLTALNNKISGMDYCGPFCHGAAKVRKDGKWGIINKKGDFLVPCKYDKYYNMTQHVYNDPDREDGYCGVRLIDTASKLELYCNKYGEPFAPPADVYLSPYFDYNEYVIYLKEKPRLYHNGKLLIDTLYRSIMPIKAKEMFYIVTVDDEELGDRKTGLLNASGQVVVPLSENYADFRPITADCEYIIFQDAKTYAFGIMSSKGSIVHAAEFRSIYYTLCESKYIRYKKTDGKEGMMGKDLKKMFEFDCDDIFQPSMADGTEAFDIWKNGSYLFTVDSKGEKVSKPQKVKGFAKFPANYEFKKRLNDDYILLKSSEKKQGEKLIIMHKSGKLSKEYNCLDIKLGKDHFYVSARGFESKILDMDFNVVEDNPGVYCGNYYYKKEGENKNICFYNTKGEKMFPEYNFNEMKGTSPYGIGRDEYNSMVLNSLYAGYDPDAVVVREASGKWGVIDIVREKVIVPFVIEKTVISKYDDFYKTNVDYFSDGLVAVRIDGRWYYVDKDGNGLPSGVGGR